jgi:transposase
MSKESQTSGKRPRRSFTDEFKRDAVNLVAVEGYSFHRAAQAVGVSSNSLRGWYEKFVPEPEACGDDATFQQLPNRKRVATMPHFNSFKMRTSGCGRSSEKPRWKEKY